MNVRESLEALEEQTLSPYASFSSRTRGRDHAEPLCDIRPEYQRDRDRILHCKGMEVINGLEKRIPCSLR